MNKFITLVEASYIKYNGDYKITRRYENPIVVYEDGFVFVATEQDKYAGKNPQIACLRRASNDELSPHIVYRPSKESDICYMIKPCEALHAVLRAYSSLDDVTEVLKELNLLEYAFRMFFNEITKDPIKFTIFYNNLI